MSGKYLRILRKILQISIFKTFVFNARYFWGGYGLGIYAIISRYTRLDVMRGNVEVVGPPSTGMLQIGFRTVGIFDEGKERAIWRNSGKIILSGKTILGQGTRISNSGTIEFGDKFTITANSSIYCANYVKFGKEVLCSWDVLIMDTDGGHKIIDPDGNVMTAPKPIEIGNHVWIGCRSTILKGSKVADGNVIAAGGLITGEHKEENSIITGNRIIRENVRWVD